MYGDGRRDWRRVGAALEVPVGMRFTLEDEWHLPIRAVACPFCTSWVAIDALGMIETLWMHEYECEGIVKDYELALAA